MTDYSERATEFFEERGPEDVERFVDKNIDIAVQIKSVLDKKGWSQKEFARALDKSESEVSKWLSGVHNLTLKSIAKMEAVLDENIIVTPLKARDRYSVDLDELIHKSGVSQQYSSGVEFSESKDLNHFTGSGKNVSSRHFKKAS